MFDLLEKELGLEEIEVQKNSPMETELSFYSFKVETKQLATAWKSLVSRPWKSMGHKLLQLHHRHSIGNVTLTELYPFEPKFIVRSQDGKKCLYMYYIDR